MIRQTIKVHNSLLTSRKERISWILVLPFLLAFFIVSCGVKEKSLTPEEKEILLRKELGIRSQTKWSHSIVNQIQEYDLEGRLVVEKWLNPNGVVVNSRILEYNNQTGKLENIIWYRGEHLLRSKYIYTYDRSGNLEEEQWLTPFDEIQTRTVYNYRGERLKEAVKYDRNDNLISTAKYSYEDDKLSELIETDRQEKLISHHRYLYNGDGNLIEEHWLNEDGEITTKRLFSYENGVLMNQTEYRNNEFFHLVVYEYDSNGLMINETWYLENEEPLLENVYTYDYY